jgi:Tfp pilus assembly protein PilN
MITINLLPIGAFKEQYKGRVFLAAYSVFMLILIAALFSVKTNVMDSTVEELTKERDGQQNAITSLTKEVTEANKLTEETVRQWSQLTAILELEERRRDQTRLLVEIEQLVPKADAWLLSLKHDQGVVTIEGISRDKETVSQFLSRLENAKYIDRPSVTLVEITQNLVINNVKLTKFKITARTSFPQPAIIDEGMPDVGIPAREDFIKLVQAAAPDLATTLQPGGDAAKKL